MQTVVWMLLLDLMSRGALGGGPAELRPAHSIQGPHRCGAIAVAADDGLWTVESDGTNAKQIVESGNSIEEVEWSPKAGLIAFTENARRATDLYLVTSDGEQTRRLTNNSGYESNISWSPDGKHLLFDRYLSHGQSGVFVADLYGNERLIARGSSPVWGPDGSQIVFSSVSASGHPADLFRVQADGGPLTRLSRTPTSSEYAADWSQGTLLFYRHPMRINGNDGTADIWTLDLGTLEERRGSYWHSGDTTVCKARFSPTGEHITYVEVGDDYSRVAIKPSATLRHAARPRGIKEGPDSPFLEYYMGDPQWSPDGQRLLFENAGALITVNLKAKDPRIVLTRHSYVSDLDWAQC